MILQCDASASSIPEVFSRVNIFVWVGRFSRFLCSLMLRSLLREVRFPLKRHVNIYLEVERLSESHGQEILRPEGVRV